MRDLLADRCAPDAVTRMYDGDRTIVEPLWSALAVDIGLAGCWSPRTSAAPAPRRVEAAAVLEELGPGVAHRCRS